MRSNPERIPDHLPCAAKSQQAERQYRHGQPKARSNGGDLVSARTNETLW